MTTLDHIRSLGDVSRQSVVARGVNWLISTYRAWKNRREFYHLGQMSDAELADIGLRRADLHVSGAMHLGIDPTARLGAIAEARALDGEEAARRIC